MLRKRKSCAFPALPVEVLAILNDGGLTLRVKKAVRIRLCMTCPVACAPALLPSGPIEVAGGIEFTKGQHYVRFTVIGTNDASLGHAFGADCLELRP